MKVTVKGVDKVNKKLDSLKKKVLKKAIRKGSRAGAKIVQSKARDLAPVKTGALKKGLKVRALPRSRRYVGTMVRLADTGEVFYGAFVDLGTHRIEARHFLKQAADDEKERAINTALAIIKKVIEQGMSSNAN